ncbi:SPW repeat protein [Mycobacterium sp. NPDC003449]
MTTFHSSIERHPDIMALRAGYDRVAESMPAQITFGLTLLTAVYVAIAPWIVGYESFTRLAVNDLVVGGVIALLAICFSCALDRAHGMTWTVPVFGVWLVVSPWVFVGGPTAGIIWSHVISGLIVVVLGLNAMYFGMRLRNSEGKHA